LITFQAAVTIVTVERLFQLFIYAINMSVVNAAADV